MDLERYREFLDAVEASPAFHEAGIVGEFTEELARLMGEQGVSRAELARRLGTSQAWVTKVLRGNANFTAATMARLAAALGSEVRIRVARGGSRVYWRDEFEGAWHSSPDLDVTPPGARSGR